MKLLLKEIKIILPESTLPPHHTNYNIYFEKHNFDSLDIVVLLYLMNYI